MRSARTHLQLTRALLPSVDDQVITRVNKSLDNPTAWDKVAESVRETIFGTDFGKVPGLSYKAHRKFNHDIPVAILKGVTEAGVDGAEVALAHLGLDILKDEIVRGLGTDVANAIEKNCVASGRRAKARRS